MGEPPVQMLQGAWAMPLAFEHEHQSPASKCEEEFDWDKVYTLAKNEWGWKKPNGEADVHAIHMNGLVLSHANDVPPA